MKHKDRAQLAIASMTVAAVQTKKLAEWMIDNNRFTSESIGEATGVPRRNISRMVTNLAVTYGFVFECNLEKGRYIYQLTDCKFNGTRNKAPGSKTKTRKGGEKIEDNGPVPLKKPIEMNPLWATALQMSI